MRNNRIHDFDMKFQFMQQLCWWKIKYVISFSVFLIRLKQDFACRFFSWNAVCSTILVHIVKSSKTQTGRNLSQSNFLKGHTVNNAPNFQGMFPRAVARVLCSDQIEPDRLKLILYLNIDMNLVSATDFVSLCCLLLIAVEMIWILSLQFV